MITTKEEGIIYETLLSFPGMNDAVKFDRRIPRKNILLLSKIIELGLSVKEETPQGGILAVADKETLEEIKAMAEDMLKTAGLTEMNDKLLALKTK